MESEQVLAGECRRMVDEFIAGVLDDMELGDLERNVLGVALRAEVEARLLPGFAAVLALLLQADSGVLGKDLPAWLDRVQEAIPGDADFFAETGRCLDPAGYALLEENLGLLPGESVAVSRFKSSLWGVAPLISRVSGS